MRKKHVLLVDDNANNAILMKDSLADLGTDLEVHAVVSGEEALRLTEQTVWDLVVTDHRMPGITGLELIQTLRKKTPATIAILITACGSDEVEQAARQLNVHSFLIKPFPLAVLRQVIQDALVLRQDSNLRRPKSPVERGAVKLPAYSTA